MDTQEVLRPSKGEDLLRRGIIARGYKGAGSFLEALKYVKTFKKHPFESPGGKFFLGFCLDGFYFLVVLANGDGFFNSFSGRLEHLSSKIQVLAIWFFLPGHVFTSPYVAPDVPLDLRVGFWHLPLGCSWPGSRAKVEDLQGSKNTERSRKESNLFQNYCIQKAR